ncbi:hypothetical protein [Corynebacterium afermentans]|uniref:hypothetical protein n=1 Tax=Corynebacterium afermentans TaxID=38286 RepID=UPI002572D726|nr:hypothetical protein [Corynebacterium afermentans]
MITNGMEKGLTLIGCALLTAVSPVTAHASENNQYQPGDTVPLSVDPDGFLPNTVEGEISFFSASSPVATCINVQPSADNVKVTNNCPGKQGIKVLIPFGQDSECVYLAPYATHDHQFGSWWNQKARFDGVVSC